MSDETPRRYKAVEELTPAEHLAHLRGSVLPETDAYRERRREALEDAGLEEPGEDSDDPDLDDMTPEEHFRAIRRTP